MAEIYLPDNSFLPAYILESYTKGWIGDPKLVLGDHVNEQDEHFINIAWWKGGRDRKFLYVKKSFKRAMKDIFKVDADTILKDLYTCTGARAKACIETWIEVEADEWAERGTLAEAAAEARAWVEVLAKTDTDILAAAEAWAETLSKANERAEIEAEAKAKARQTKTGPPASYGRGGPVQLGI